MKIIKFRDLANQTCYVASDKITSIIIPSPLSENKDAKPTIVFGNLHSNTTDEVAMMVLKEWKQHYEITSVLN